MEEKEISINLCKIGIHSWHPWETIYNNQTTNNMYWVVIQQRECKKCKKMETKRQHY